MKRNERRKVAKEAARLLYYNLAGEYKQAKEKAAKNLKTNILPSNSEIALELDKLADEIEMNSRKKLIVDLRKDALQVMNNLKAFYPKLIGSVWRGTARKGSDIDIEVFSQDPNTVIEAIKRKYKRVKVKHISKRFTTMENRFLHVYFKLSSESEVEVIIKGLDKMYEKRKCEVYGDSIYGLTLKQIRKILEENPSIKFVPKGKMYQVKN